MRDPDRIEPFLAEIAKIWRLNPDLRLGQMLENCNVFSLFYIEDDVLLAALKHKYNFNKEDIDDLGR